MSSHASEQALAADPENRLLSRFNRQPRRCRDAARFNVGRLGRSATRHGRSGLKWEKGFRRRTVYGEVSRFRPERFLTLFDFPDPSFHSEKRIPTNTSVQRLFFLNSEFIKKSRRAWRREFARRRGRHRRTGSRALRLVFGREPESREMEAALQFLESRPADTALPEFAQVLLSSSEFSFVD